MVNWLNRTINDLYAKMFGDTGLNLCAVRGLKLQLKSMFD